MPAASTTPQSKLRRLLGSGETLPSLIWVFGFCMVVGWLVVGRIKLRRIAREAWPLSGSDWQGLLADARAEAGISSEVDLLCSPVATTPLTWGTVSPVILLPEGALEWPEEHRRVVLRHELAHIARKDSLTQSVTGFICALYWFHPLVWMSERRLRAECERACDDRVVALGTPAAEYAWHLLEVAQRQAQGVDAIPQQRQGQLGHREAAGEADPQVPVLDAGQPGVEQAGGVQAVHHRLVQRGAAAAQRVEQVLRLVRERVGGRHQRDVHQQLREQLVRLARVLLDGQQVRVGLRQRRHPHRAQDAVTQQTKSLPSTTLADRIQRAVNQMNGTAQLKGRF